MSEEKSFYEQDL